MDAVISGAAKILEDLYENTQAEGQADYLGYTVAATAAVGTLTLAGYLACKLCQRRGIWTREVEQWPRIRPANPRFLNLLNRLKNNRITAAEFLQQFKSLAETERYLEVSSYELILAIERNSRRPYHDMNNVLAKLFQETFRSNFSADFEFPAISSKPIAKDAPINFIWVGSPLPDHYLSIPAKVARMNPDRETILWYYSPCLNASHKAAMQQLENHSEYREAVKAGTKLKVLDFNEVSSELVPVFNQGDF